MMRLHAAIAFAILTLVSASATPARAQWAVDFAFGSGGYRHHHGGWYGGYGFYPYYPRPYYNYVYVAPPPPVVYVPTGPAVVAAPVPLSQAAPNPATFSTSSINTSPVVRSNNVPSYQGPGITIRNPAESRTSLALIVDNRREIELAAGEAKLLNDKNTYHVEFDRGGDFGTASKNVSEGSYEFVATARGWDLQRIDVSPDDGAPMVRRNALPTTR